MRPTISPQLVIFRSRAFARQIGQRENDHELTRRSQQILAMNASDRIDLLEYFDFRKSQISEKAICDGSESYLSLFKELPPSLQLPDFFAGMLFRDLLTNEIKHEHHLSDEWQMNLRVEGAIAVLMASNRHLGLSMPWQYTLDRFLVMVQDLKTLLGSSWNPRLVSFTFKRPTSLSAGSVNAYETIFKCRIAFGADINALHFDSAILDQVATIPSTSPTQFNCITLSTSQNQSMDPFLHSLARVVRQHPAHSAPSLNELCDTLHLSKRSLQQRLRQSGTSYRQLSDYIAMLRYHALEKSGVSFAEIAQRLGYSEPSALHRAKSRWRNHSRHTMFDTFASLQF